MNNEKQLLQRIETLLSATRRARNAADIARFQYDTTKRLLTQQRIKAQRLDDDVNCLIKMGREAVFELMVSVSHRRFMRFLRDKG